MSIDDTIARNTLHAAAVWMERAGIDTAAVVVVTMHPRATVGFWLPSDPTVVAIPAGGDAEAELAEAVSPWVEAALARLRGVELAAVRQSLASRGVRLQVLVAPATGDLSLRLIGDGRPELVLAAMTLQPAVH